LSAGKLEECEEAADEDDTHRACGEAHERARVETVEQPWRLFAMCLVGLRTTFERARFCVGHGTRLISSVNFQTPDIKWTSGVLIGLTFG
jgi:hypothetical protein